MIARFFGKNLALCFYFSIVMCVFFLLFMRRLQHFHYKPGTKNESGHRTSNKTPVILLWNDFYDKRWNMSADTMEMKCPHSSCIFTNKRDYLSQLNMFDAVLFYAVDNLEKVPQVRDPKQLYVFVLLESPMNTRHDLLAEGDFYNLTMTYRMDSDVVWSYGKIAGKESETVIAPSLKAAWRNVHSNWTQKDNKLMETIKGKKKLMAWMESNCKTSSKREELVKELQQYLPIDIYGSCGNLICPNVQGTCNELLKKNYKFYLAFEDAFCTDYVTGKIFIALENDVVPVVLGGADYSTIAPPHSYIDAKSFANTSDLVNYLTKLDKSAEDYARYFWWKRYYKVQAPTAFCDLCERIKFSGLHYRIRSYNDIEGFWKEDRTGRHACKENVKFFTPKDKPSSMEPKVSKKN